MISGIVCPGHNSIYVGGFRRLESQTAGPGPSPGQYLAGLGGDPESGRGPVSEPGPGCGPCPASGYGSGLLILGSGPGHSSGPDPGSRAGPDPDPASGPGPGSSQTEVMRRISCLLMFPMFCCTLTLK